MDLYPFAKAIHEQHLREAAKKQLYEELVRHNRPNRNFLRAPKSRLRLGERLVRVVRSLIGAVRPTYAPVRVRGIRHK